MQQEKKLSVTAYQDTMKSKLVKKFSKHGGTRAKAVVHPIFGACHQHTLAFSTCGHFKTFELDTLKDAVATFKKAPSCVLGRATHSPIARKKENVNDTPNHLVIFDVEFFEDGKLFGVEEIALTMLERLGNKDADFIAFPTASYGCAFEKNGTKNAIRLFVRSNRALTCDELARSLPSTEQQDALWGKAYLDTGIYQPERLIFTQVEFSEFASPEAAAFFGEEVLGITALTLILSLLPFKVEDTKKEAKKRRAESRKNATKQVSPALAPLPSATSSQGFINPSTSQALALWQLIELREPSCSPLMQTNGAERHTILLHGACSLLAWSKSLGYSEEDARDAFFCWVSRTNKELHVAESIFAWGVENYEEQKHFFPRSLEAVVSMLPNAQTKYLAKADHPEVCALWCSMGSGKTVYSREWIEKNHQAGQKTLVVVPRVALSKAVVEDLRTHFGASDLFVTHYRDEDAAQGDVIVTTVHSALNFINGFGGVGAVVVDEVMQVRKDLASQPMIRSVAAWSKKHNCEASVLDVWEQLLTSPRLLLCDAYMGQGGFLKELQELRPEVEIVKHTTRPTQQVFVSKDADSWVARVKARVLDKGERCFASFSSKKQALSLAAMFEGHGKSVLVLSSDNSKEEGLLDDVDTDWLSYDCVFTTTAISSGVSFDAPDHFDFVAGYFVDRIGLSVFDELQMLGRVRNPRTPDVLICASNLGEVGRFEDGDLEEQVKRAYKRREAVKELSRDRVVIGLDRLPKDQKIISIEDLAEATLDLDPSFPLIERIIKEEVKAETGHKNFWKCFSYFFGGCDEEDATPEQIEEVKEARKKIAQDLKEAKQELLDSLDEVSLSMEVEEAARASFERAEAILERTHALTASTLLKSRAVWLEANFKGLDPQDFVGSDQKMANLQNALLFKVGCEDKASTTLEAVANPNLTKEAALWMLKKALHPYKKDPNKNLKATWLELRSLASLYEGFFNKIAGISLVVGEVPSRRVVHALAANLGWSFTATLVREKKDKKTATIKPKKKKKAVALQASDTSSVESVEAGGVVQEAATSQASDTPKKKRKYVYAFDPASPSERIQDMPWASFNLGRAALDVAEDLAGILQPKFKLRKEAKAALDRARSLTFSDVAPPCGEEEDASCFVISKEDQDTLFALFQEDQDAVCTRFFDSK